MHIKAGNCARTPKIPCSGDVRGLSWQYFIQSYAAQYFELAHFYAESLKFYLVLK